MKNFKERIKNLAKIVNIDLKNEDCEYYNLLVNKRISYGLDEEEVLGFIYLYTKRLSEYKNRK